MSIKQIVLVADDYGATKGTLRGSITFTGQYGEVKLTLQQKHVARVTELLAEAIVESVQDAARLMTKTVIEQGAGEITLVNEAPAV